MARLHTNSKTGERLVLVQKSIRRFLPHKGLGKRSAKSLPIDLVFIVYFDNSATEHWVFAVCTRNHGSSERPKSAAQKLNRAHKYSK